MERSSGASCPARRSHGCSFNIYIYINCIYLQPKNGHQIPRPPSTSITAPVSIVASSLANQATVFPISAGVARRPMGIVSSAFFRASRVSVPENRASPLSTGQQSPVGHTSRFYTYIGVSPNTGWTTLNLNPFAAHSSASPLLAVVRAALLAAYHTAPGRGREAEMLETVT